jgi:hypothetical protein
LDAALFDDLDKFRQNKRSSWREFINEATDICNKVSKQQTGPLSVSGGIGLTIKNVTVRMQQKWTALTVCWDEFSVASKDNPMDLVGSLVPKSPSASDKGSAGGGATVSSVVATGGAAIGGAAIGGAATNHLEASIQIKNFLVDYTLNELLAKTTESAEKCKIVLTPTDVALQFDIYTKNKLMTTCEASLVTNGDREREKVVVIKVNAAQLHDVELRCMPTPMRLLVTVDAVVGETNNCVIVAMKGTKDNDGNSLTYLLTQLLTRSLTHSLTHSLIRYTTIWCVTW